MIRGFYTARSGLMAHQEHMNTIANNLANVNTVGFKPHRTAFKDLIYQNLNREGVENEAMIGHGVKINKNDVMMAQGALATTDHLLDFALTKENQFFSVEDAYGNQYYTRAGNFYLSDNDGTYYLVTANGEYVLDTDEEPIEIEFDDEENMVFDPNTIGVFSFPNPYGLSLVGDNRFIQTDISGEAEEVEFPSMMQGYLENSGVEIAVEMANVIEAQKAFSFSSRMVTVADEIEQTINNLR